jgi:hypothetical protein
VQIYISWMYLIFLYLLPFSLLAVYNSLIYAEIRQKREGFKISAYFCTYLVRQPSGMRKSAGNRNIYKSV